MKHLLPNIVKDLVFDGTLYHLWYLPALLLVQPRGMDSG